MTAARFVAYALGAAALSAAAGGDVLFALGVGALAVVCWRRS